MTAPPIIKCSMRRESPFLLSPMACHGRYAWASSQPLLWPLSIIVSIPGYVLRISRLPLIGKESAQLGQTPAPKSQAGHGLVDNHGGRTRIDLEQTALLCPGQDMLRNMGGGDRAAAAEARPIIHVNEV